MMKFSSSGSILANLDACSQGIPPPLQPISMYSAMSSTVTASQTQPNTTSTATDAPTMGATPMVQTHSQAAKSSKEDNLPPSVTVQQTNVENASYISRIPKPKATLQSFAHAPLFHIGYENG